MNDAFQAVLASVRAYHGLLMDVTKDSRIDIDIRIEICDKMRAISKADSEAKL